MAREVIYVSRRVTWFPKARGSQSARFGFYRDAHDAQHHPWCREYFELLDRCAETSFGPLSHKMAVSLLKIRLFLDWHDVHNATTLRRLPAG